MTIQQMKYILAIANYKSFSKAAKALFVSQSTLSTAVRDVENSLGITLFYRTSNGVTLTYDGEDFLRYTKEIVSQTEFLEQKYHSRKAIPTRFSVSAQHLPFAVRAFIEFFKQIDIDAYDVAIRECDTYTVIHNVSTKKSELGILAINSSHLRTIKKVLATYDLRFYELAKMKNYVFFRATHPLAKKAEITLADLEDYPFVTYDQSPEISHYTEEPLFYKALSKNVHVCDRCTKIAAVRKTNCFSIGPDLTNSNADKFHKGLGEIIAIPLNAPLGTIHAGYITLNEHSLSDYAKSYLSFLKNDIKTLLNTEI